MLTRKEKARLTKAMHINQGLRRDLGVYSVNSNAHTCARSYIHMSEEMFKHRFIHYETRRVDPYTLELSVRMNGFIIMTLSDCREGEE